MERVSHTLVSSSSSDVEFIVLASDGLDELAPTVRTERLALPKRPAFARIAWFYLRSGARIRRLRAEVDLVHTCGAVTNEPEAGGPIVPAPDYVDRRP